MQCYGTVCCLSLVILFSVVLCSCVLGWVELGCVVLLCVALDGVGLHLLVCDSVEADPKFALIVCDLWQAVCICLLLPAHSGHTMTRLCAIKRSWAPQAKDSTQGPSQPVPFPVGSGYRQIQEAVGKKAKSRGWITRKTRGREKGVGRWAGGWSLQAGQREFSGSVRICDSWERCDLLLCFPWGPEVTRVNATQHQ